MRKVIALALVSLTGCANFCDTFFRARNVCRDQSALAGTAAPVVVSAPVMSACSCAGGHVIATSEPYSTEVFSPSDCACSGAVVMAPAGVSYGSVVEQPPVVMGAPAPYASAVQPVAESKGHPMLRPFQWLREHHQSKQ